MKPLRALTLVALTRAACVVQAQPQDLSPMLNEVRALHKLPALAVSVIQSDQVVGRAVVGVRRDGDPALATLDDLWHHGSLTKSMTATLAALLTGEGRIGWASTLAEVFPADAAAMAPAWRGVTLEQLLGHRGGAPDQAGLVSSGLWREFWDFHGTPQEQRRFLRERVTARAPQNPPGQKFLYSNASYILAGAMLEERMGKPWETLITERLFRPLGMKSAGFGPPGMPGQPPQPWGHVLSGGSLKPMAPGPRADNPPGLGPAGTVHTTMADFTTYIRAHLDGEAGRDTPLKLPRTTWQRLHQPLPGQDYGLGWFAIDRPWAKGKALNHNGTNTLWYTTVWMAPKRDFAVIVLTNVGGDDASKASDEVAEKVIRKYLPV
jgi:CubicO group peptidase (beta-lactamase class C family)